MISNGIHLARLKPCFRMQKCTLSQYGLEMPIEPEIPQAQRFYAGPSSLRLPSSKIPERTGYVNLMMSMYVCICIYI